MKKGRLGRLSERAGRNASERRAGLETVNAEADPPRFRGRLPATGTANGREREWPVVSAGVLATACTRRGVECNTGSPVGGAHAPTENPRGPVWAGRVAERPVVPRKRGNARGGKGPWFERDAETRQGPWGLPQAYKPRFRFGNSR